MPSDPQRSERVSGVIAAVAACVPIAIGVGSDPATDAARARAVTLGVTMAGDRSGTLPLTQVLAPLSGLLPIGSIETRAAIALALPAALATWLVTRRASEARFGAARWSASALVLAFGALVGVSLSTVSATTTLAAIAIEGSVLRPRRDDAKHGSWSAPVTLALGTLGCWGAPRLAPAIVLAMIFALRRQTRLPGWTKRALFALCALSIPLVLLLVARDRAAWLVTGRPMRDGAFAAAVTAWPAAALARVSIVALSLSLFARVVAPSTVDPEERGLFFVAAMAIACGLAIGAEGGFAIAVVALAPTAAAAASAVAMAVARGVDEQRTVGRRALAALVPVLMLGLVARSIEVELASRHLDPEPASAHAAARIFGQGLLPSRAVIVVESEAGLLRWAEARVFDAIRPDVRVLPTHGLLLGGAARLSSRTIAELPSAAAIVRGLLAHGVLEEPDLAPLAQDANVVTDLAAHRLLPIARHVDPHSGLLHVALSRFDPSDRRLRRVGLERRTRMLARALSGQSVDDPLRAHLRLTSLREARVLAMAGDRDAALVALLRAQALGAPIERWFAKVSARQPIESDPPAD